MKFVTFSPLLINSSLPNESQLDSISFEQIIQNYQGQITIIQVQLQKLITIREEKIGMVLRPNTGSNIEVAIP